MPLDRDHYGLALAQAVSLKSKDPSTKCGAVIMRHDGSIASTGYNGFPKGMPDLLCQYHNRDEKLRRVLHAEENAILFAREDLSGYTICVNLLPCAHCMLVITQSGIKRVVCPKPSAEHEARWDFSRTRKYAEECHVDLVELTG